MNPASNLVLFYVTHADEQAAMKLASELVQRRLAACANAFPIQSVFHWEGEVRREGEWVTLLKTTESQADGLAEAIAELHPYDTPCILRLNVAANPGFAEWAATATQPS